MRKEPAEIRFWRKVTKNVGGCWEWTAYTDNGGYGRFGVGGGKSVVAHRFSYETSVGPVPAGLDLDHLCRNRRCVNPAHLEPVTRRENIVRGISPNAKNAAKTHCRRGHELTQENCYATRWPNQRQCKLCAREAERAKRAARRGDKPRYYRAPKVGRQTNDLPSAERNAEAIRTAIREIEHRAAKERDGGAP